MLTTAGRRVRSAVTAGLGLLLLAGTFVGDDDDFPFGPFKMYAGRHDPDAQVVSTRVEALDRAGRVLVVDERSTGLRRAEIEGQIGRLRSDPALLGALSRAHDALQPDEPPYAEVRVVERRYVLRDSRPTGEQTERVVASWSRP